MINLNSKKGTSNAVVMGIVFFLIFFSIEFIAVTYLGADSYVNAPEIQPPSTPEAPSTNIAEALIDAVMYPIENIGYFFSLMLYGGSFGVLNSMLMLVFFVLLLMYVLQLVRGN